MPDILLRHQAVTIPYRPRDMMVPKVARTNSNPTYHQKAGDRGCFPDKWATTASMIHRVTASVEKGTNPATTPNTLRSRMHVRCRVPNETEGEMEGSESLAPLVPLITEISIRILFDHYKPLQLNPPATAAGCQGGY